MRITLIFISLLLAATSAVAESLILTGATVYPSPDDPPIENAAIVIRGGKIEQVGPAGEVTLPVNSTTLDLAGKYITAGFWNNHVHYLIDDAISRDPAALQQFITDTFLKWGFTTTVDTGSDLNITNRVVDAIDSGAVNGPTIFTIGGSFVPPGGSPFYIASVRLPELTSPERATTLTNQFLDRGLDGIKLFTGSWATVDNLTLMDAEAIRTVTDIAHNRGALVFAHPSDSRGARLAIDNGVDVLAHTFPAELAGPWDRKLPADLVAHGAALVPTLKLFRVDLERIGLPPPLVERLKQNAIDQTAAVLELGGDILFGTDVGYMADTDTTEEFEYMARAGMTFEDILRSLTTNPAKRFGQESRTARIAPGFMADLVILEQSPAADSTAFGAISMTLIGGKVVYRQ